MSPDLEMTLIVFLCVAIFVTILIGVLLALWLINLNKLTSSLAQSAELFRMEFKPILEEIQVSLSKITLILSTAGNNVGKVNKIIMSLLGILGIFLGNFKSLSGGLLKGVLSGIKLFR